ncbi:DUF7009 family protein [Rhizosphaericola mali]|uniref:Uncharacterized protein n=1 Tax=Rhizosphaericola mali TaxID=2545455 RepID=A0A5P2FY13_9BACT|nr:hypothetical protein [Rhizosphaericola mali]QES88386.1 hypothetical protein E0W69_006840 [Rhizosphaericola mali]
MKIRIKGNTLRLRLAQSEVEKLAKEGSVKEETAFFNKTLSYAVISADVEKLETNFDGDQISIFIPKDKATALFETKKVGFEEHSGPVAILIEKDFVCIDNTSEDQSDNYPNPKMQC